MIANRARRAPRLLIGLTAGALLLTGCASESGGDDPSPRSASTPSPSSTPAPSAGSSLSQPLLRERAVPVYYVGRTPAGPRLFREFHRMRVSSKPAALAKAALGEALTGRPLDPDYRTPWPSATRLKSVRVDGGSSSPVTVIDLSGDLRDRPNGMRRPVARMAVEQVVRTAQAGLQSKAPVRILLDGQPTDRVLGVPASQPIAPGAPERTEASVWIYSPQDGDRVNAKAIKVTGRGAFFEANVSWQVLRDGSVVKSGFTTAREGMTLSPYEFTIRGLTPGSYLLRVYDEDMSDGEGRGEAEDTKRITVG